MDLAYGTVLVSVGVGVILFGHPPLGATAAGGLLAMLGLLLLLGDWR